MCIVEFFDVHTQHFYLPIIITAFIITRYKFKQRKKLYINRSMSYSYTMSHSQITLLKNFDTLKWVQQIKYQYISIPTNLSSLSYSNSQWITSERAIALQYHHNHLHSSSKTCLFFVKVTRHSEKFRPSNSSYKGSHYNIIKWTNNKRNKAVVIKILLLWLWQEHNTLQNMSNKKVNYIQSRLVTVHIATIIITIEG